jgi:hypothetical protein
MKNCFYTYILVSLLLLLGVSSCETSERAEETGKESFAKGADISWLPQMEESGYIFYNDDGVPEDCFKILKDHGINSIRLRTWVNPSDDPHSGHCSKEETVEMAKRAKEWGMSVMDEMKYSERPISATVSENIADIYQDVRNFVSVYQMELTEQMQSAINICTVNFRTYWGQKLVNVLRPLHSIKSREFENEDYDDFLNMEDSWD